MLETLVTTIQSSLIEIIGVILLGVASLIGTKIKQLYEEKVNTETKQKVVKTVVEAMEQLYKDLKGQERLELAKQNVIAMLNEKGLTITDLEMSMLIEAAVNEFNKGLKGVKEQ